MHRKSDSEATSIDAASSPARSPRRHPPQPNSSSYYYVQSPSQSQHEGHNWASPATSPHHHHHHPNHYSSSGRYLSYHCPSPPPHHSRESSTTRFSASLKNASGPGHAVPWRKLRPASAGGCDDDDDDDEAVQEYRPGPRFYAACFVASFAVLFFVFSLIIWGASQAYQPQVTIKSIVFHGFNVQAGTDFTGVPTKLLSVSSTVRLLYRNTATFFGVHVSSTPLQFFYYQQPVASGQMKEFYQPRKSQRVVVTSVKGKQVPLYGGGAIISSSPEAQVSLYLNLTFTIRSRAYVLGKLVKPVFHRSFLCPVVLRRAHIGKSVHLNQTCFDSP